MSLPSLRALASIVALALPLAACFDPTEVEDDETEASTAGDTTTGATSTSTTSNPPMTSGATDIDTSSTGPGPDPSTDSGATSDTTGGLVDSSSGTSTGGDDMSDSSSSGSSEDSTTGPVIPEGMCNEMLNVGCGGNEWCDYPDDLCGAGMNGVCMPQPMVCNLIFAPHCGCDGADHSNACVANANGTDIDHPGNC